MLRMTSFPRWFVRDAEPPGFLITGISAFFFAKQFKISEMYATIVRAPVVAKGIIVSQVDPFCLHPCRICTIAERQIH